MTRNTILKSGKNILLIVLLFVFMHFLAINAYAQANISGPFQSQVPFAQETSLRYSITPGYLLRISKIRADRGVEILNYYTSVDSPNNCIVEAKLKGKSGKIYVTFEYSSTDKLQDFPNYSNEVITLTANMPQPKPKPEEQTPPPAPDPTPQPVPTPNPTPAPKPSTPQANPTPAPSVPKQTRTETKAEDKKSDANVEGNLPHEQVNDPEREKEKEAIFANEDTQNEENIQTKEVQDKDKKESDDKSKQDTSKTFKKIMIILGVLFGILLLMFLIRFIIVKRKKEKEELENQFKV